jgi:hypothetical protein
MTMTSMSDLQVSLDPTDERAISSITPRHAVIPVLPDSVARPLLCSDTSDGLRLRLPSPGLTEVVSSTTGACLA